MVRHRASPVVVEFTPDDIEDYIDNTLRAADELSLEANCAADQQRDDDALKIQDASNVKRERAHRLRLALGATKGQRLTIAAVERNWGGSR